MRLDGIGIGVFDRGSVGKPVCCTGVVPGAPLSKSTTNLLTYTGRLNSIGPNFESSIMLQRLFGKILTLAFFIVIAAANVSFSQEKVQVGTPPPLKPDVVGAGGEYTQSVPFSLPEFRGLVPNIRLSYNSSITSRGGVDNIIAFGWRLSGFSVIERVSLGVSMP